MDRSEESEQKQANVTDEAQKKPDDEAAVPEDVTVQQLGQTEEVLNSSAQEEKQSEKSVGDKDAADVEKNPEPGVEKEDAQDVPPTQQKDQDVSEAADMDISTEAEPVSTEEAEKCLPTEEMVEIEPNADVDVTDHKVGDDEPMEREIIQDKKEEETSETEKKTDEETDALDKTEKTEETKSDDLPLKELPNPRANITVKVKLMPAEQVITVASMMGQTIGNLKEYFATELKMKTNQIKLHFGRNMLNDMVTLGVLGVEPNGTVQLELMSTDPEKNPLKPYKKLSGFEPDIVSINIPDGNEVRAVTVEIEKTNQKKPFLGGFRHRISKKEFHNASTQTNPKPLAWPLTVRFSRATQTAVLRDRFMQTAEETSTQMTKIGYFVSVKTDKLLTPGTYFTAQEKENLILSKVIILQTYLRRYLAKMKVKRLMLKKSKRIEFEMQQDLQRKQEKEKRIKAEFERRMHPRTGVDFDTLYNALERWRLEEIARINSTMTGSERKAALYMLLNQETEHLAAIGRHRVEADTENKDKLIERFLHKTSAPKMIKSRYDNLPTLIETPYTTRAKELRDIYNSIHMKYLTQDERFDILLTLKHTVQEHDCKLTQEILKLIDRETDLLVRGVSNENLEGLRKRIGTLFLQYIKTPLFNPESAKFIKVPPEPAKLSGEIYFCISCGSYLQSSQFLLNLNANNPGSCKACKKKDNEGRNRLDDSSYRHMLKVLRMNEERYNDNSTVAFLLQESDMRYLVEKVWDSESIISNTHDLYDLVFVRWDADTPWSPWNCLLVTIVEAEKHGKLLNIYKSYGEVIVDKVQKKHQQARNYFSRLPRTANLLRKHLTPLMDNVSKKQAAVSKQTSGS